MQNAVFFLVDDDQPLIFSVQHGVGDFLQPCRFPLDLALERLQIENLAGKAGKSRLKGVEVVDHRGTLPKHPVLGGEMLKTLDQRAEVAEQDEDIAGVTKVAGGDEQLFLAVHPAEELFDFTAEVKGGLLSVEDNVHPPPAAEQDNQQRQQDNNEGGAELYS